MFNVEDSTSDVDNGPSVPTCSKAQEQEINDLMECLKLEQNKYLEQKILCDLIEDIINEDNIDAELKSKVKDIMISESVKQTLSLGSGSGYNKDETLLGIELKDTQLTYSESNILKDMVKKKLSQNPADLAATHESWIGIVESINQLNPTKKNPHEEKLLEYRHKLNIEHELYLQNLQTLHSLLEEITNKRVEDLPQVLNDKLRVCQLEQKINSMKSTLTGQKCRVDIFTETSCSLPAYQELIKELKEEEEQCKKEIERLEELKEQYKQVSGKEYDEILKSYLQYKSSIEKKKTLLNALKK